jgi:hypothetical protein
MPDSGGVAGLPLEINKNNMLFVLSQHRGCPRWTPEAENERCRRAKCEKKTDIRNGDMVSR